MNSPFTLSMNEVATSINYVNVSSVTTVGHLSNQKNNQPTNQPANQPTNQQTNQPANQPTKQPKNKPNNKPANKPANNPTNEPPNQPSKQPTNRAKILQSMVSKCIQFFTAVHSKAHPK